MEWLLSAVVVLVGSCSVVIAFWRWGIRGAVLTLVCILAISTLAGCTGITECVVDGASHAVKCAGLHAFTESDGVPTLEGSAVGWLHSLLHVMCPGGKYRGLGPRLDGTWPEDWSAKERDVALTFGSGSAPSGAAGTSIACSVLMGLSVAGPLNLGGLVAVLVLVIFTAVKSRTMVRGLPSMLQSTLLKVLQRTTKVVSGPRLKDSGR